MPQDIASISMDGSSLSWKEIDAKAKKLNMDRSEYVQSLAEKDFKKKRLSIFEMVCLLCFALIIVILVAVR